MAFFDGNMLFLMQKSMARYVLCIIWTATACCTAAATSFTQDRISPSWIPIKVYHQRGFLSVGHQKLSLHLTAWKYLLLFLSVQWHYWQGFAIRRKRSRSSDTAAWAVGRWAVPGSQSGPSALWPFPQPCCGTLGASLETVFVPPKEMTNSRVGIGSSWNGIAVL